MDLGNVKTERLLPAWMRDRLDDLALARSVDEATVNIYESAQLLTTWDKIDQLPEGVLDRLARELDIDWYDAGASIETKRALIKTSDYVHAHKGTVAAVETLIQSYFGSGWVIEWPEYAGSPHHFKVFTDNPSLVGANQDRFLSHLSRVKRYSSKLDEILIGLTGNTEIFIGSGNRDRAYELHQMGDSTIHRRSSVGTYQYEHIEVRILSKG